jgi:hypothetical protein
MLNKYCVPLFLAMLILVINVVRFVDLEGIPNGYMFDEETSSVTLQCLAEKGIAPLDDTRYPLFGELGVGNPKPPTYMYPGMLWVKGFGFSASSVRALTAFSFILALLGLFAIAYHWGGLMAGLWTLLAGSISPWMWSLTRMGIEGPFLLPFLVWGLFVCLKAKQLWQFILAGALFAATVYTYPTAKMQAPLLLIILGFYGTYHLNWKRSQIITLVTTFMITLIPLIASRMSDPALNEHFKDVFITNPDYLRSIGKTNSIPDLISVLFSKAWYQISPDYLFFKGTPTDMGMTTGRQGLLSWLDGMALIIGVGWIFQTIKNKLPLIKKEDRPWATFIALNIFLGTLPAVFCHNNDPLHSMAAWPFVMIATGMTIHMATKTWSWSWLIPFLTTALFAGVFFSQYFTSYKNDSVWIFRKWSLEAAKQCQTKEDWMKFLYFHYKDGFASRYFLMRYHGDSCIQARNLYNTLKPDFEKIAEQNKKVHP